MGEYASGPIRRCLFIDYIKQENMYWEITVRVGVIKIVIVINCNLITLSKVIACNFYSLLLLQ